MHADYLASVKNFRCEMHMPQIVVRVDERGDPPVDPPGVNLACISRYDMRSVPLRTGTAAKERMKINDLIPLGTLSNKFTSKFDRDTA